MQISRKDGRTRVDFKKRPGAKCLLLTPGGHYREVVDLVAILARYVLSLALNNLVLLFWVIIFERFIKSISWAHDQRVWG